ncbi:MAG: hypothetical protein WBA57_00710 [Elainellaceae cyanobacterium]
MFPSRLSQNSDLQYGAVVYAPGWSFCYRVVSGPFCRVHYIQWRGLLACTSFDSPAYYSYLIQVLGGRKVRRLRVRQQSHSRS